MLFEKKERIDIGYKEANESNYIFLDRIRSFPNGDQLEHENIRSDINKMLVNYPDGESRNKIIAQFKSKRDGQFREAFFELFIYHYFKKMGLEINPINEESYPDFQIKINDELLYLEATTLNKTEHHASTINRRSKLISEINNKISSEKYILYIYFNKENKGYSPKISEIVKFLESELGEENLENTTITYSDENYSLDFKVLQKSFRRKKGRTIVNSGLITEMVNTGDRLRDSLKTKNHKYSDKNLIIAINCLEIVDQGDREYATQKQFHDRSNNICNLFFNKVCEYNYKNIEPEIYYHPTADEKYKNLF